MGELPIFSTKAHIFQIDPDTKKKWLPLSTQAIPVSFYHDSARHLYRIISVDGVKVLINSTLAPNMNFTKTSQKFGQWSDAKASTVYGLGFGSEEELIKFMEKFDEVKQLSSSPNDSISIKKSAETSSSPRPANHLPKQTEPSLEVTKTDVDQQLEQVRYENDRLKIALAQSSANAKKWETELQTLRNNNIRLNAALQESAANVEEWKKQLQTYKEDNTRLQLQINTAGSPEALEVLQRQLNEGVDKVKLIEQELTNKQQMLDEQKVLVEQLKPLKVQNQRLEAKVKALEEENARVQLQLSNALTSQQKEDRLKAIQQQLSVKINELYVMNDSLAEVLQSSN